MLSSKLLLDGIPRSLGQTELLEGELGLPELVLNLDVPFATIIDRLSNRLTHLPSGRVYNLDFNPPKQPGIDDITGCSYIIYILKARYFKPPFFKGEKLVFRPDDDPDIVSARLKNYEMITSPILEHYRRKNLLKTFSGTETNQIWPEMHKFLSHTFSS